MHWSAFLVFYILLLTSVTPNPINKHSLKLRTKKHIVLPKKIHSEASTIKSNIDAFKFLTQFGYNKCEDPSGPNSGSRNGPACQSSLESMLEAFQTAYHLPVTKKLDAATIKLMNTPRCHLPDIPRSLMDKSKLW
jgi:hypothetical protein